MYVNVVKYNVEGSIVELSSKTVPNPTPPN